MRVSTDSGKFYAEHDSVNADRPVSAMYQTLSENALPMPPTPNNWSLTKPVLHSS